MNIKTQFENINESNNEFLPLFEKYNIAYLSKDFLHLLNNIKRDKLTKCELIEYLVMWESGTQKRIDLIENNEM